MPTIEKTHEYRDRLRWNNTELITPSDLNVAQSFTRRYVTDLLGDLGSTEWAQGPLSAPAVRPIGNALRVLTTGSDLQVAVDAGGFLFAPASDPGPDHTLYHRIEDLIVLGEASPGHPLQPRHDLVTLKVEDGITSLEDEETRVFRDTATGKRSSQEFCKRTRTRATLRYHEGSPFLPTADDTFPIPGDPLIPDDEVPIARLVVSPGMTSFPPGHAVSLVSPYNPNSAGVHGDIRQFIGVGFARGINETPNNAIFIEGQAAFFHLPLQVGCRLKEASLCLFAISNRTHSARVLRMAHPEYLFDAIGEVTFTGNNEMVSIPIPINDLKYVGSKELWVVQAQLNETIAGDPLPRFNGVEIVYDKPRGNI